MKVGVPLRKDSEWRSAKARADEAMEKEPEERKALLVEHEESDVEMEDEGIS